MSAAAIQLQPGVYAPPPPGTVFEGPVGPALTGVAQIPPAGTPVTGVVLRSSPPPTYAAIQSGFAPAATSPPSQVVPYTASAPPGEWMETAEGWRASLIGGIIVLTIFLIILFVLAGLALSRWNGLKQYMRVQSTGSATLNNTGSNPFPGDGNETPVPFVTTVSSKGLKFDGTSTFTSTKSGLYDVNFNTIVHPAAGNAGVVWAWVAINGVSSPNFYGLTSANQAADLNYYVSLSTAVYLKSGDTFQIIVSHSGSNAGLTFDDSLALTNLSVRLFTP